MQEVKKDSIISIREAQITELKEDYDGAVSLIDDLRLEAILKDEEIFKLKKQRKVLLSVSGGLLGFLILSFVLVN